MPDQTPAPPPIPDEENLFLDPETGELMPPAPAAPERRGAGDSAFSKEVSAILRRPLADDEPEIMDDGSVYIPHHIIRRRLLEAFGPGGWAQIPVDRPKIRGDLVHQPWALICLGRWVGEATGGCRYIAKNPKFNWDDALEGASSLALVRIGVKKLGIGLESCDRRWREQWRARCCACGRDGKWARKTP